MEDFYFPSPCSSLGVGSPLPTLMVVPSGIGCSVGGFAGDAIPSARLLAAASGCLVTHPNVMNGAMLYWSDPRIHYVEGYGLDRFATGEIALRPVRQQKIGLLVDSGIELELRERQLQVADACKATLGLNLGPVVITELPLSIQICPGESGTSWGEVGQLNELLRAGKLLQESGATAIAVVTRFPETSERDVVNAYRHGNGVDPLAGAEAVISHLLVRHLGIPCAHAPALPMLSFDSQLDPRAAAEELGHTFLPCVLVGLSRAPDLVKLSNCENEKNPYGLLRTEQLGAVVAPDGALGNEAVLACLERGLPLIAVTNQGILNVNLESLGICQGQQDLSNLTILKASNYVEAAGWLMLIREGIAVESLQRPICGVGRSLNAQNE